MGDMEEVAQRNRETNERLLPIFCDCLGGPTNRQSIGPPCEHKQKKTFHRLIRLYRNGLAQGGRAPPTTVD